LLEKTARAYPRRRPPARSAGADDDHLRGRPRFARLLLAARPPRGACGLDLRHAMTLHLVYEKASAPSTRIRLVQMAPHLESRGLRCRVVAYPGGRRARQAFRAALAPGDVVLVHRARPTPLEARWWRSLPVWRIYDIDDAVMWGRRLGWRGA